MDDLLCGVDTIKEAVKLREQIDKVLLSANFKLRKYQSNSVEFLDTINAQFGAPTSPTMI